MSVTNYIQDSCKYYIGKLMKSVYLISEDAVKDIRIDNGDAYINSVSESPMRLDCYSITLQEEESLDERYRFVHTLTFSVNGYANSDDFQGRFYAIVKDNEGTYWLVNPLFPCKVTYTYTLGYQQNHTDFTMATVSNHPVLRLHNFGDATPYECQEYFLDGIDALWMNEKRYTVHDGNSVKYTNDGFKTIEYNQRTATFTETFDGTNTSHQIDFDILFSQYKSSWHYNLLEFKDNLYSAIFKTRNGKYALCGFSFGLQPSFRVSADDTIQSADRIQITLQDAHDVGDAIEFFDSIDYEYLSARTYEYTSEYDGYDCVGEGIAKYLLQKEVDALGNETGNYKVLEGYAGRFPGLNIVGTFSDTETFTSVECNGGGCTIDASFPSTLTFNNKECQTYYLKADSSWSISSSASHITVSPSSGDAGIGYSVNVCNTLTPGAEAQTSTLNIQYCSTSTTVDVNVVQNSGCFPQGAVYNVSANAQVLNVPTACCVQSVRETTNVGSSTIIYNSYLGVTVPENNTGRYRTITLLVVFCDGTSANVVINQSNVFEKWVDAGGTFCIGHDLYKQQNLWTGSTSTSYVITPTTRSVLAQANSPSCYGEDEWIYDWKNVDGYVCDNCGEYKCLIDYSGNTYVVSGSGEINRSDVSAYSSVAEDVVVEPTVTSIGNGAFRSFRKLFFVRMPNTVTTIGSSAFTSCDHMIACELPEGVTTIGDYAFSGCTSLSMVNIPDTVTSIGRGAFTNCLNFRSISIPSGVTSIARDTFYNCDGLTDIELPSTIVSIGDYAFAQCEGLYSVILPINVPPAIGYYVFGDPEGSAALAGHTNSNLKIYVPSESVDVYKITTGWSTYANYIYPIE